MRQVRVPSVARIPGFRRPRPVIAINARGFMSYYFLLSPRFDPYQSKVQISDF